MNCCELDSLYRTLINEKMRGGMTDRYFRLVGMIKDHFREGHKGKRCPDPENRLV